MTGAARAQSLTVSGTIRVPGDKSISHRALIFGVLAVGTSRIQGILESADVQSTAAALRALGASIPALSSNMLIDGCGPRALRSPQFSLDCGNSGTTTRLLTGLIAGLDGVSARFEGDASLSRRPMRRVTTPLAAMGARIAFEGAGAHDGLPMCVDGTTLHDIVWQSAHASAQVKGALLLAGLASGVSVEVLEPEQSRDHSERMLRDRGVSLASLPNGVRMEGQQTLSPRDTHVPGDPSSATFFAALAALADRGTLRLVDVCLNPTRTGAFDVLRRMGMALRLEDVRVVGGEPMGTLVVGPGALTGTRIHGAEIPRCIDELPMLACVAARATGETVIGDASELRVKESDRIRAVVENLRAIGVDAEERPDGMRIVGSTRPMAGRVRTHGDHRLAMAFGVLAALPGNNVLIDDPDCVAVSYPLFWRDLSQTTGIPLEITTSDAPAFVLAIDGPAASGKSSTAQWVAQRLSVRHVDSGAFYRALTHLGLQSAQSPADWTEVEMLALAGRVSWLLTERSVVPVVDGSPVDEALRGLQVTRNVSRVAQMGPVREWVNTMVRAAAHASAVVVDGRDIGTAVFPNAQLKVFLVADPWERARRRLIQRLGRSPSHPEIAEETELLVLRDAKDATQSAPARDAITIDTTSLTQEEQVERIVQLAKAAIDRQARSATR